jgi:hypothetical protein
MSRLRRQWLRPKRSHRVSDCSVGCCARALSLIVPPCPLPVGRIHQTIGLFRTATCALYRDTSWALPYSNAAPNNQEGLPSLGTPQAESLSSFATPGAWKASKTPRGGLRTMHVHGIVPMHTVRAHPPCCGMISWHLTRGSEQVGSGPQASCLSPACGFPHGVCSTASPNQ